MGYISELEDVAEASAEMRRDYEYQEPDLPKHKIRDDLDIDVIDEIPVPETEEPENVDLEDVRLIFGDDIFNQFLKECKIIRSKASVRRKTLSSFIRGYIERKGHVELEQEEYTLPDIKDFFGETIHDKLDEEIMTGNNKRYVRATKDDEVIVQRKLVELVLREAYSDIIRREQPDEILDQIRTEDEETLEEETSEPRKPAKPIKIRKKAVSKLADSYLTDQFNMKRINDMGICCGGLDGLFGNKSTITRYELTNYLIENWDLEGLKILHEASFCQTIEHVLGYLKSKYPKDFKFSDIESPAYETANDFVFTPRRIRSDILNCGLGKSVYSKYIAPHLEDDKTFYTREEIEYIIERIDGDIPYNTRRRLLNLFKK